MKTYHVHVLVKKVYDIVEVEAESKTEAATMVSEGDGRVIETYTEKCRHEGSFYVSEPSSK